jgi:hypothetical protein
MAGSFTAQVTAAIAKHQKRQEATFRASAQQVAREVIVPVAKGGNMRVLTGFLRASLMASASQMPEINPEARPPKDARPGQFAENIGPINLVIAGTTIGETVYLGFTAAYAGVREYHDGFVKLTAQRWQAIVDENARKAIAAFP